MPEHTPGSWIIINENYICSNESNESGHKCICKVFNSEYTNMLAVAPDLLKALDLADSVLRTITSRNSYIDSPTEKIIKDAISKATEKT